MGSKKLVFILVSFFVTYIGAAIYTVNTAPKDFEGYDKAWAEVKEFEDKGLPKSALEKTEEILAYAKKENNSVQIIKAIIHKSKYTIQVEEDGEVKAIQLIEKEIETATAPAKNILQSMLAEMYWNYYTANRWQFMNRTQTVNFKNDDIRTYDIKTLFEKTMRLYISSLNNSGFLKKTPVEKYKDILTEGDKSGRTARPTVYDFVAHRALDFMMNDEAYITQPAYKFEITDEAAFADNKTFAKHTFESKDTLSNKLLALKIFRELTQFHLQDPYAAAIVDVDLKRLNFVHNNSTNPFKDSLYLSALQQLEKKYENDSSSTSASYIIAQYYNTLGGQYNPLGNTDKKWFKKKAIEKCNEAIKRFPNSIGAQNCKALKQTIEAKSLQLNAEIVNIPGEPFRSLVKWKNINEISLRIVQLNDNDRKDIYGLGTEDQINYYKKLSVTKEWTQALPDDGDYNEHSAEIKIDALPTGNYIIMASADKNFSLNNNGLAIENIWVSNISYISNEKNDGATEFYVLDRTAGTPLKNAIIQTYTRNYNYSKSKYEITESKKYTSDENGYFKIEASDRSSYLSFTVAYNKDFLAVDNNYYLYKYKNERNKNTITSYLFTDRSIYRPGQTIYFKGIIVESTPDGKTKNVVANKKTSVTFYDVNYQKISALDVTTNAYGSYTGTFTAPAGVLIGAMTIKDDYGEANISVEEYKRPKFEVVFDEIKGSYILNDTINITAKATSYAGANIDNATVTYRVTRTTSYPWWYDYEFGYRKWMPPTSSMEIVNGETKTDAGGNFIIHFKAIPDFTVDKTWKPQFSYTITADVTDVSGETRTGNAYANVGYISLNASVNIGETVSADSLQKLIITSTNLNGAFEPAKGNITVYKLKQPDKLFRERFWEQPDTSVLTKAEYYKNFPHDLYADENNKFTWPVEKTISTKPFNTADTNLFVLDPLKWEPGEYKLELISKDKSGAEIKTVNYFTVISSANKNIPQNYFYTPETFLSKEPGETAIIQFGSAAKDVNALLTVYSGDKIITNKWIKLNNELQSFSISVAEEYRGGINADIAFVKDGRIFTQSFSINVPWSNKDLKVELETHRNKLLPGETETWKIKITGNKGEKVASEFLAGMYDASLDAFKPHSWSFIYWPYNYERSAWSGNFVFGQSYGFTWTETWNPSSSYQNIDYDYLNWFGLNFMYGTYRDGDILFEAASGVTSKNFDKEKKSESLEEVVVLADGAVKADTGKGYSENQTAVTPPPPKIDFSTVSARTNLNETAFFYPQLETDENGAIIFSFTVPQALTRWNFMGLAHTKNLQSGFVYSNIITQKDLMVTPNAPRFFREGDIIELTAKVQNITDSVMKGTAQLELFDAITMKPIDAQFGNINTQQNFTAKEKQSASLSWKLKIPEGYQTVLYRIKAKAATFTDGEENVIPVLTNKMLVTESLPLPIRWDETKSFTFQKLIDSKNSSTLKSQNLSVEFTSNPAWYAIQALPYLMEYPYECAEQLFNRYYANSIATFIANSDPKIKMVFNSWKGDKESLLSNLEKNQELKSLLLQETPWVLEAQDETERKKRVALLFDINKMSNEMNAALNKLENMQAGNGAWPWFAGMPESRYITQYIVTGLGHLDNLGIKNVRTDKKSWNMTNKAIAYLDMQMLNDYNDIIKYKYDKEKYEPSNFIVQYMYARSYFNDIPMNDEQIKAKNYFITQIKKYWLNYDLYAKGMIALALHRNNEQDKAMEIIKSLKEFSLNTEEMGMYWKENVSGYYWYQAPIETQALMIETFDEVANDQKSVQALKIWLLKNKQTNDWKTTKATAEACYALLLNGTSLLSNTDIAQITIGKLIVKPETTEAGTGYFKESYSASEITPDMGNITVTAPANTDNAGGISWGAMYWQYFEQLDKITPAATPLQLNKKLFLQQNTASGPVLKPIDENTTLQVGDIVKVRIELRVDRDMEYIHLKDMRASCFEPINVLSGYKYQDGLGYYESTGDAATNFFMEYLPKGTYVFEYPLRVTHKGDFSNGISSIQSMYAPEFTSHSEGVRVNVK